MTKVKNFGGSNQTTSQRDEAHVMFHVRYIVANAYTHPSAAAGERERLLTCLIYPILAKKQWKPRGSDDLI